MNLIPTTWSEIEIFLIISYDEYIQKIFAIMINESENAL
jgi:hypothetical protein